MRPITGATMIAFIYTALTSEWVVAYNEVVPMMNLVRVAPESVPNISQDVWGYIFTIFSDNTNIPIFLFSLLLLCASLITKLFQIRDELNLA